jgi:hypothetical protein
MSLTLWHTDRLRGTLFIRHPSRHQLPRRPDKGPTISAVLIPAAGPGLDAGLWQIRISVLGDSGPQFLHTPLEPDIVAQRHTHQSVSSSGSVALHPMTAEERQRIRPTADLSIRDGKGRSYVPRQLRLEEMRMEPQHYEDVFSSVPRESLIGHSIWTVFAAFDLGADAPAT